MELPEASVLVCGMGDLEGAVVEKEWTAEGADDKRRKAEKSFIFFAAVCCFLL